MSSPTLSFSEQRQRNADRQRAFDVQNQLEKISLDTIWCGDHAQLQIVSYCSNSALAKVRVSYRMIRTNGGVDNVDVYVPITTDRVVNVNVLEVGKGWLQSVSVIYPTSSSKRGDCWNSAALIDRESARQFLTLCYGYCTAQESINYPPGDKQNFVSGNGNMRSITGTNPAAGANISETVPTNAVWKLKALATSFTTSGVAGTRRVYISITDGTTELYNSISPQTQAPGATIDYFFGPWPSAPTVSSASNRIPTIPDILLPGGYTIDVIVSGGDAGDDFAAPQLLVEEWLQE